MPETVRFRSADDDSLCVSVIPLMALCIVPADSATAPPVTVLGILATSSEASAVPPEASRLPVAARTVVPVAGTVTCAPVAVPPNVCAVAAVISARFNPAANVVSSTSFFM